MRSAHLVLIGVVAAAAVAIAFLGSASPVRGVKPTTDASVTGIIYYASQWNDAPRMWRMNADGSQKTPLPENVDGEPSREEHGGHRWFLNVRATNGETTSGDGAAYALLAIRDDGFEVPLSTRPDWEPGPMTPRWLPGSADALVSWVARRRDADDRVVEGGLCVARLQYDAAEDVIGLVASSERLHVPVPLVRVAHTEPWCAMDVPDISSHDWSPDARHIVFDSFARRLVVADVASGAARELQMPGGAPVWSPDGTRVAFQSEGPLSAVAVIQCDATGLQWITEPGSQNLVACGGPVWSPTGSHLAYRWLGDATHALEEPIDMDVCLAPAQGNGRYVLTTDTRECVRPIAWRDSVLRSAIAIGAAGAAETPAGSAAVR